MRPNSHSTRLLVTILAVASGTALAQTNLPTLSITAGPDADARLTNSTVVVGGVATDDSTVVAVEWQLSNTDGVGGWQTASGTTNWSVTITNLAVGTNTVSVRALDDATNLSSTVSRSFVLLTPLTVTIAGCGSVSPDDRGTTFKEVGVAYAITAIPCPGFALANWTGGIETNTAALNFIMRTGLVLQANFAPGAYAPRLGVYYGLISDTNEFSPLSSGYLTLKTTAAGRFSGTVQIGATRYPFAGQFDPAGHAAVAARRGNASLPLDLQVDTASGAEWLVGTITNTSWRADLKAWRAVAHPAGHPAQQAGRYTMFLAGHPGSANEPAGDSYGTLLVSKAGRTRAALVLADGTRITQSASLGRDGQWAFYVSLYRGGGLVQGWLSLPLLEDNLTGDVRWVKPAQARTLAYTQGFSITTAAHASPYTAPKGTDEVLDFSDALVDLYGGSLSEGISNRVVLLHRTRIDNLSPNRLIMRFSASSGLFHGRVVNPATHKPIVFQGAADQSSNQATGFFLSGSQSGRVLCEESFSLRGEFAGLFYVTNQVSIESSGSVTLTTARGGSFSGRLRIGTHNYSFSGRFNGAGHAHVTIKRSGLASLIVDLRFEGGSDGNHVVGTVSDGVWTAQLAADRPVFNGKDRVAPQAGTYTFIISGTESNPALPAGDGYGTVTVSKNGDLSLAATLADGTKITQSASVSETGQWPMYAQLYSRQGSLLGWMNFVTNSSSEDLVGDLIWIKPLVAKGTYYPAGFALETSASGSRYSRPDSGTRVLNLPNATVSIRGGNLAASITNQVTLGTNNLVINLSSNALSLTFSLSSGLFSGKATVPPAGQQISFNGVVLQKAVRASGFFLGTDQSGRVSLQVQ